MTAVIVLGSGKLADIESSDTLEFLSAGLRAELKKRNLMRLDPVRVRSKDRDLTRAASRLLFEAGHAGIDFCSALDDLPCCVLFEGRARLERDGTPIALAGPVPEMEEVCSEYGLRLEN